MPTHEMLNILREAGLAVSGPIKMAWVCWAAVGVMLALGRGSVRRLTDGGDPSGQPARARRVPPRRTAASGLRTTGSGVASSLTLTPIASNSHLPSSRA